MIKVSVIMPSLNVSNYIEKCLQSVVKQTLHDIEIICVDAGSTDGTLEILERFAEIDSRIAIIHSDKKSYGYQMNLGIKRAKGEYIGIVETDDFVSLDMFERLYEKTLEKKVDFVKSNYISFFNLNGNVQEINTIKSKTNRICNRVLELNRYHDNRLVDINNIWTGIYRRAFLIDNELWFNETLGASFQDTSFSILVGLVANSCIYLDEHYYYYRIDRPESSVRSDKKIFCVMHEFQYINRYINVHECNVEKNKDSLLSRKIEVYWWNALRLSGDARKQFVQAVAEEISEIISKIHLSQENYEKAQMLTDERKLDEYVSELSRKKERFFEILNDINADKKKVVVVGAGRFFNKLLAVQAIMDTVFIEAVCDNDARLQGTIKANYKIISVEQAVENFRQESWLVLNKRYGKEIREQLEKLGIADNRITVIDMVPDFETICSAFETS